MSEAAQAAWQQRFESRQVALGRNDPEPFITSKVLGRGGWAEVYEVELGGVPVALKRTRTPRITVDAQREIEILQSLSQNRHEHIVALIGSYSYKHKRRGVYEIGIVLWPVARCDLTHFMQELDITQALASGALPYDHSEDIQSATELLAALTLGRSWSSIEQLYGLALRRLRHSYGCIAEAVAWLHDKARIRHKDLKPSQILLSGNGGLWLTDFGLSAVIPDTDYSATSGHDRVTPRYEAPERATGIPRGRPEDVFGLGCIYLEMSYRLYGIPIGEVWGYPKVSKWSYQANVQDQLHQWIAPLIKEQSFRAQQLGTLLESMLAYQPDQRPSAAAVVRSLSLDFHHDHGFFNTCCSPRTSRKSSSQMCHQIDMVLPNDECRTDAEESSSARRKANSCMTEYGLTSPWPWDGGLGPPIKLERPWFRVEGFSACSKDLYLGRRFPQIPDVQGAHKLELDIYGLGIMSS